MLVQYVKVMYHSTEQVDFKISSNLFHYSKADFCTLENYYLHI